MSSVKKAKEISRYELVFGSLVYNIIVNAFQFNMLVSYTYRSDDPAEMEEAEGGSKARSVAKAAPEMKTFSFYTVVNLGIIVAKEEPVLEQDTY